MRWGEHWRISKDCYEPKKSLMYQLGSILPDWFMRHPIHRWNDTKDIFLERAYKVLNMKEGPIRDWNLGVLSHFVCDYCCMAHNEEYYDLYKHRVYEVLSQKLYKKMRLYNYESKEKWIKYDIQYEISEEKIDSGEKFKNNLTIIIEYYIKELHDKIKSVGSIAWYKDHEIMELDILYSYALLKKLIKILS